MHFTRITVGIKNRSDETLHGYHDELSNIVVHFMDGDKIRCPTCSPQTKWDE